jgi:DnaJ-class molecular chaperone
MEITFTRPWKFRWWMHWYVSILRMVVVLVYFSASIMHVANSFVDSSPPAKTGFSLTLTQLDGQQFSVTIDDIIECDEVLRVPGKGMPRRSGKGFGDLFITFEVDFPDVISPEQKKQLRQIFAGTKSGGDRAGAGDAEL